MAAQSNPSSTTVRKFRDHVRAYYEATFERFPAQGTEAGRHEFDGELGRATPATFERHGRFVEATLAAVEDLPVQDFNGADLLDRRALLANLRLEQMMTVNLVQWRRDPQVHLHTAADAIYGLVVRHADDLGPVAEPLLSRIRKLPRYLGDAAECLQRPDPLWKELALSAAPGVGDMLEGLKVPLGATGVAPVAAINRAVAKAREAIEGYAAAVRSQRPAARGSFAIGEERMASLMHERLGLSISPREAVGLARRRAEELDAALRREARRLHARKPARELIEEAAADWNPGPGSLIEHYRACVADIRERFIESGWVGFPKSDTLLVKPVPGFMRDLFPTAAYSAPGALDPDQTGIFWVNDLGDDATPRQRAAELAQHFGLELTCAHEAYPGHHLQFVSQNAHPALARKMAHHAIYYEGWTLWCEQMVTDLLGEDPDAHPCLRLVQLHDELWRAWRIVIDVGLQTGELTCDAACKLLMEKVGFTKARAQGDVNWYTSAPTVPMSYLLGKMELLRLKHKRVDRGGLSLREFNDWVLSFGAIPWRWIEECGWS